MKLSSECISCVLASALELMAKQLPSDRHQPTAARMLELASQQDWQQSPPEFARELYGFLQKCGGSKDSFAFEKQQSTRLALQLLPELRKIIEQADDQFACTVKAVIGGNIIDCGADRSIDIPAAVQKLKSVFDMPLEQSLIRQFEERFYNAKSIFYMLDNCGEAVLDKLLLERFPGRITLGVRGSFILNDITMHELADSQLDHYPAIDTGDSTPGVAFSRAGKEFINAMRSADLVIAKGQGNFETMDSYDRPIVHLLRVKCPVVARNLKQNRGELALVMRNMGM